MTAGITLVTGASGFIGQHVCRHYLQRKVRVRGLCLPTACDVPAGTEVCVVSGLDDKHALRRALRGVDTVIHLAARVHVMHEATSDAMAAFRHVNVEGTRVLLEEATATGITRFLFMSSVKAMGESNDEPWTEETPPRPIDPYGISKLEAEIVVSDMAMQAGIHAIILRLPLAYGPGMRANMLRLFRIVDRGVPLPFGAVRNRRSLIYCGNVVAAIETALASKQAANELFLVNDGRDLSTSELIRAVTQGLGRPTRLLPVPPRVFRSLGRIGDRLSRFGPVPLTTATVERLVGSLTVDSSKFRNLTGFRPPHTVTAGLQKTAQWYRARKSKRVTST